MRNPVNHTFTGFLVEVSTQKVESEAIESFIISYHLKIIYYM
jgi:hypothetical protein